MTERCDQQTDRTVSCLDSIQSKPLILGEPGHLCYHYTASLSSAEITPKRVHVMSKTRRGLETWELLMLLVMVWVRVLISPRVETRWIF